MARPARVFVRCLGAPEPIPVDVDLNDPLRNTPLWQMAADRGCAVLLGGRRVYGTQTLAQVGVLGDEATVHLGWPRRADPCLTNWESYVKSTTVTRLQRDVDPNIRALRITWKPNLDGNPPDLSRLDGRTGEYQNLWRDYFTGERRAQNPKAAATPADWDYWLPSDSGPRCVLVELSEEFTRKSPQKMMEHIDAVRYDAHGINNSYYGGERRSWQRYTHEYPLPAELVHAPDSSFTNLRLGTLQSGTWYALLLLNVGFTVLEDTVIPFKTWKSPPLRNTDCPVCMEPLGLPDDTHQCRHCGHGVHDWCRTEACAMCRRV